MSQLKHFIRDAMQYMPYEISMATWLARSKYLTKENPQILDDEWQTHLQTLHADGACVVENFFTEEECRQLRTEIDNLLITQKGFVHQPDKVGSDHRIYGAQKVSKVLDDKFGHNPDLMNMAMAHQGNDVVLGFTLAAKMNYVENNPGSGGGWHRDSFLKQFKCIVYLSDVDETNGPFQFIKGSHQYSQMVQDTRTLGLPYNQVRMSHEQVQKLINRNPERLLTATARAGTVLLANTSGIHRGKPIEAGQRYALTNYYYNRGLLKPDIFEHFKPVAGYHQL